MTQLILAYLFAAVMILTLFYLGKKNQREGWRKMRVQPISFAVESNQSRPSSPEIDYAEPLGHLKELEDLNRALTAYQTPQKPAVAIPVAVPVTVRK